MSLPSAGLLLVRALPVEIAIFLCRLLVIFYLILRGDYRREIGQNYYTIFLRHRPFFWLTNAWMVGRNLALMAKVDTGFGKKVIDRALFYQENDYKSERREDKAHTVMASFHFGLWEFLPRVYAKIGYSVGVMVERQRDRTLDRVFTRLRQARGVILIHRARDVVERVQGPGVTGFMLDNTSSGKTTSGVSADDGVVLEIPKLPFVTGKIAGWGVTPVFGYWNRGRLMIRVFGRSEEDGCVSALLKLVKERPAEWIFWGKAGRIRGIG